MAVKEIVDIGDERSALAAQGHVGGTKISDGGDAGAGGDDGGLTEWESGGSRPAEIRDRWTLMEDGLAVGADEGDFCRGDAEALAGSKRGIGENLAETEIELAELAGGDGLLFGDAKDFFSESGRKFYRGV